MKTIKVTDRKAFNHYFVNVEIDVYHGSEYNLYIELTPAGYEKWFEEAIAAGEMPASCYPSAETNTSGKFGEDDYIEYGFKIVEKNKY